MYELTYFPWIAQHLSPTELADSICSFAAELEVHLARLKGKHITVKVLPPLDIPQQIEALSKAQAQIALMNPLGFAIARHTYRARAVVVACRNINGVLKCVYNSYLYTHTRSGINSLSDAMGTSIGFGTSSSTSNFLFPAAALLAAGIHPFIGFSRIEFLGNHDAVAQAVYAQEIALGAGHCGTIHDLSRQLGYCDAHERLKVVADCGQIPSDPIATNVSVHEAELLQLALIESGKSPAGRKALFTFWGGVEELRPTQSRVYNPLFGVLRRLNISPNDLMR